MDRSNKKELRHKLLDFIETNYCELYTPLLVPYFSETELPTWNVPDFNDLYISGTRRFIRNKKFDVREIYIDSKDKIIDWGCNTGYFCFYAIHNPDIVLQPSSIARKLDAGKLDAFVQLRKDKTRSEYALGIDSNLTMINLCNIAKEISDYENISFEHIDIERVNDDGGQSEGSNPFDTDNGKNQVLKYREKYGEFTKLLVYSVYDFDFFYDTNFLSDMIEIFNLKKVYFEPTNHYSIPLKEYEEWTLKYKEKYIKVNKST